MSESRTGYTVKIYNPPRGYQNFNTKDSTELTVQNFDAESVVDAMVEKDWLLRAGVYIATAEYGDTGLEYAVAFKIENVKPTAVVVA